MISEETFRGGASYDAIVASTFLPIAKRVKAIDALVPGLSVFLPNATKLQPGTRYYVMNVGLLAFDVATNAGVPIITAAVGFGAILCLVDNSTQGGLWVPIDAGPINAGGSQQGGLPTIEIVIDRPWAWIDVHYEAQRVGWDGVTPSDITLRIEAGVGVGTGNTSTPAVHVPNTFPAGTIVRIVNRGYIDGAGGQGGNGATTTTGNGSAGSAGGTALLVEYPCDLDNLGGEIRGGGGGGGGAGGRPNIVPNGSCTGGGGGGGQCRGGGQPGVSGGEGLTNYAEPGWGNPSGAGAGGIGGSSTSPSPTQPGGDGGTWGQVGVAGASWSGGGTPTTGGAGGAGGLAIQGYSLLTVLAAGTILGGTAG